MSQTWEASTDVGVFNDWFALDTTEELPPRYDGGFIPDLEESWISASMASEVLPDPNNSSLRQFNADVTSFEEDAGCKAGVDPDTSNLDEPTTPRRPSLNRLDCLSDFLNYEVSESVNMVTPDGEEAKTESTHHPRPSSAGKSLLGLSEEPLPAKSGQQRSAKRSTFNKSKSKRTKIPNKVRIVLDAHFNGNPYPTDGELIILSGKTGLLVAVIKRWFMNARSRKTMPEGNNAHAGVANSTVLEFCHHVSAAMFLNDADGTLVDNTNAHTNVKSQEHHVRPERSLSPRAVLCYDSLQDLDRCSPAPSVASLERYLNQPAGQDSIPASVIKAALQADQSLIVSPVDTRSDLDTQSGMSAVACFPCRTRKFRCSRGIPTCTRCQRDGRYCIYGELPNPVRSGIIPMSRQQSPMRAFSTAGSNSSVVSHFSIRSLRSHISVDSRGSRRGRKRWIQPPSPPDAHRQKTGPSSLPPEERTSSLAEAQVGRLLLSSCLMGTSAVVI